MREAGLQGARRGKTKFTTLRDEKATRPPDLVERDFTADAPNRLWVADLTYVRTWSGVLLRGLRGGRVLEDGRRVVAGDHLRASLATEALEMAVWRRGASVEGLVHHSDATTG